ncbi:AMP-binding protein [uncultured Tateyamaria sp.]|uniref:phenylacetate--CoA ligase family protein n=1 Tax=uncultured Tateyamaria sp. TaxID=455651 RepID=UPI0026135C8A|nr:AMP-binding protein [uncultured Tateyamaria sp.]
MRNRLHNTEVATDFLPRSQLKEYHQNALAILWRASCGHPSLISRITPEERAQLYNNDTLDQAWENITCGESYDQTAAIQNARHCRASRFGNQNGLIVFSTSGSSGAPKMLINSYDEVTNNAAMHGKGYAACGISAADTTVILGEVGRFAAEYAVIHALSVTGCTIVPIVDRSRVCENLDIMHEMNATVWLAMQSEMFPYLDALERGLQRKPKLRLIVTGGEPIAAQTRQRLREIFGHSLEIRSTFQTADTGTIGYQCAECADSEFHVHEELQYVEIVDDDGRPTSDYGHLVVTNLYRYFSPIIRIKTGDIARWCDQGERCACGRTARRIHLRERVGRQYKIGGEKVPFKVLEDLAKSAGPIGSGVKVIITRTDTGMDQLRVQFPICEEKNDDKISSVKKAFEDCTALSHLVTNRRIDDLVVEHVNDSDPNYLGFNKIQMVIDTRNRENS